MRVAVVCEDDDIWGLSVWMHAVPILQKEGHEVAAVWVCPQNLCGMRSRAITWWYLRTFGIGNFIKLGLFAMVAKMTARLNGVSGFDSIERYYGVAVKRCSSPNSEEVIDWIQQDKVDVIVAMVGDILKSGIIRSCPYGVINKHASMLPANRGLFPYLWAIIDGTPQGTSFHRVNEKIDAGELLLQEEIESAIDCSMTGFYLNVFTSYPRMLVQALEHLQARQYVMPLTDCHDSYHGLPSVADVSEFTNSGGRVVSVQDIFKAADLWHGIKR